MKPIFLTAEWNNLLMANYVIAPDVLAPYVPPFTELDFYNGNCYVSLIGFMFERTRIRGFKIPFHENFEEVNLRFYVRYNDNGIRKRGAVFIKEIVPKAAISIVANTLYNEKYSTMPMKHFYTKTNETIHVGYLWKFKNRWNKIEAVAEADGIPAGLNSEEAFITEHYWGYAKYNAAKTFEYEVEHAPWKIHTVKKHVIDCDFTGLYGDRFSFLNGCTPNSFFMAAGSPIKILGKKILQFTDKANA